MILVAHIRDYNKESDRRDAERHAGSAVLSIGDGEEGVEALLSDLSQTGLRLRSKAPCPAGSTLAIEIPGFDVIEAKVVWRDGDEFGCEFTQPISRAAASAIILRSPVDSRGIANRNRITEKQLGVDLEVSGIGDWIREFELRNQETGRRIVGFRVSEHGEVIVLISEED